MIPQTLIPGVLIEFDISLANRTLPSNVQKLLLLGQRVAKHIEPARWQGGTLNDCTSGGTYTGTARTNYLVEIDATGTPDTFQWSKDGGLTYEATGEAITGSAQTLDQGVQVTFGATTGHAVGDQWLLAAIPEPSVAEKVPTQIFDTQQPADYCGPGSMIHKMTLATLKVRQDLRLFFCSLDDDGGATAATGYRTVTGTVTTAGSWVLHIGGERFEVALAVDATAAEIAIAMQNKMAESSELPIMIDVDQSVAGKINFTAKNGGTIGNQIIITSEIIDAIGVSIAASVMSSGATDPDVDDALAAVFTGDYDRYVTPYNVAADITKVRTHLESISGPVEMRPATAYLGSVGTPANSISLSTGANSGRITNVAFQGAINIPYEIAAAYAAEVVYEEDPAQPLNGRELKGILAPPDDDDLYLRSELETLLEGGVSPVEVQKDGKIVIVRDVTTFTNISGTPSVAWRDGTTQRTLDYVREAVRIRLALTFQGAKNTEAVQDDIRSHVLDVLFAIETLDIVKDVEANKAGVTIAINAQDVNRVDMEIPVSPVLGLHVIAAEMQLILS